MWAPADLFGPGFSDFTRLGKGIVSYFYEHLMVLAIVLLLIAALITAVTLLNDRSARGARGDGEEPG